MARWLTVVVIGVLVVRVVLAAEWTEPTAPPPAGNPPGFVWTRSPDGASQPGGQFNLSGAGKLVGLLQALSGAVFGGAALDLGGVAGGQNVLYGAAKRSAMHADDALLLLQTASDVSPPVMIDRLRVHGDGDLTASGRVTGSQLCIGPSCRSEWTSGTITGVTAGENLTGGGTTGNVTIGISPTPTFSGLSVVKTGDPPTGGNLIVFGCFGPVFRNRSVAAYQGNAGAVEGTGGYLIANSRCPTGQHVCTTAEVLNTINCGALTGGGRPAGETDLWIANLAPSLPTPTNDCIGWSTASSDWWGIKWRFNPTTGGGAFAERCSTSLPFACCG